MSAYGQRLIVVAVLTVLDIANYFFGIDHFGLRNEQVIGTVITLLLAIAGMTTYGIGPQTQTTPLRTPPLA